MKPKHFTISYFFIIFVGCSDAVKPTAVVSNTLQSQPAIYPDVYPDAKRGNTSEEIHGQLIEDPYQWMETLNSETTKFIDDENNLTESFLNKYNDRLKVKEKLTNFWNQTKIDLPIRIGKYYFTFKNTGLQNHDVLYKQIDPKKEPIDVVFDVNQLSKDGSIALGSYSISDDGNFLAYGLITNGSEWITIKIRNINTLKDSNTDELKCVRYSSILWMRDNKGFFYSRYPEEAFETDTLENHAVYYHRVGTTQDKDVLVYKDAKNPLNRFFAEISDDRNFLLLDILVDTGNNGLIVADLEKVGEINDQTQFKFKTILSDMDAIYKYAANIHSKIILRTNKNAKNFQLVSFNFDSYEENKFSTFIKEDPAKILKSVKWFNKDKLLLFGLGNDGFFYDIRWLSNGTLIRTIPIIESKVTDFYFDHKNSEIFYECNNILPPYIIYHYDFAKPNKSPKKFRQRKLKGFDESKFTFEMQRYTVIDSKTNTSIDLPISIIKKKHMKGPRKCMMFGYGGYGAQNMPKLVESVAYFLTEYDGFVAFPTVRGEGHLHDLGRYMNKQNVFSDFQAAARRLIELKYTESKLIAIHGTSHGGLLVTVCVNQAPELFGAAISKVGVMDMLRYHEFTFGSMHTQEFGTAKNKTEFENIVKYSPLHNIRIEKEYPSVLVIAGDTDERAVICHSLKYAAELQHTMTVNQFQKNPALLRIYKGVGHGHGSSVLQNIEEATDEQTFLHQRLN